MFAVSEGYTTGIARYTPNKYELLNNTIIDSRIAEYSGKGTTNNFEDASIECTRKECDVFVRNELDGVTSFYKLTKLPYELDKHLDQTVSKETFDVVETKPVKQYKLEPVLGNDNGVSNDNSRNIIIIVVFIGLIIIVLYLSSDKKESALYEHRPATAEESGVMV